MSTQVIYDHLGRPHKLEHLQAVERLEKLKRSSGSNPWPVIEECFNVWARSHPSAYKSYLVHLADTRETRRDRKFATGRGDDVHGGILRYTLDIPQPVMYMIRALYDPDELDMTRDFFQEFGRRFPQFKIAERQ